MWYINTMEYYYTAIRRDEILLFETARMDIESVMLSKISQVEKIKNHLIYSFVRDRNENKWAIKTNERELMDTVNTRMVTTGNNGRREKY